MAILSCPTCKERTSDLTLHCERCGEELPEKAQWIAGPRTPDRDRQAAEAENSSIGEVVSISVLHEEELTYFNRKLAASGTRNMGMGLAWFIGGFIVTTATYSAATPGGGYIVAWGAIAFGALQFFRGMEQQAQAKRLTSDALANEAEAANMAPRRCPHCETMYYPYDYMADASRWLCRSCNAELPHEMQTVLR
jgi:hypothetical protein